MVGVKDPLVRTTLERHRAHRGPSIASIRVELSGHREQLRVAFEFCGGTEHLVLPGERLDPAKLWEHTCAEIFVGREDGGYVEWNFSPTGQATRFDFSAYRVRTSASFDEPVDVSVVQRPGTVQIVATGSLLRESEPVASLGLSAVARAPGDVCSYWALRHPTAEPDFHDVRGFTLDARALSL